MSKTKKHTTRKKRPTKTGSIYKGLKNAISWRDYDPGEKWAMQVAEDLLEYVERPDVRSILKFIDYYGIPETSYHRLKNKYECFAQAHDMARVKIAVRREDVIYDTNPLAMKETLPLYHSEFKEIQQHQENFKKELKREDEGKKYTDITVVMDDYGKE